MNNIQSRALSVLMLNKPKKLSTSVLIRAAAILETCELPVSNLDDTLDDTLLALGTDDYIMKANEELEYRYLENVAELKALEEKEQLDAYLVDLQKELDEADRLQNFETFGLI